MGMDVRLKPCPFCGGKAKKCFTARILCEKCGIEISGNDSESVIEHWNARPGEDSAYEMGVRTESSRKALEELDKAMSFEKFQAELRHDFIKKIYGFDGGD